MFPPTHPIYGAYRPRTRCCIQNKRAGLIAVIGICLFFCGILIAINTLYDLQTISLPIHTQNNLKVQDLDDDESRRRTQDLDDAAERNRIQEAFKPTQVVETYTQRLLRENEEAQRKREYEEAHRQSQEKVAHQRAQQTEQDKRNREKPVPKITITVPNRENDQKQREEPRALANVTPRQGSTSVTQTVTKPVSHSTIHQSATQSATRSVSHATSHSLPQTTIRSVPHSKPEEDQVETSRTAASTAPQSKSGEEREREEAAERQREQEEVQRVREALLNYFQEPNRMSMYAHTTSFPLEPGQAKVEVEEWLRKEGTEFIKTKFRGQHWKGQIDLQTCLTKLQAFLTINHTSTWWVIIKEDVLDRDVQEKDVVDRIVHGMQEYFSTSDRMCIIKDFLKPKNRCITLDPEDAKQKVTLWMSNGGEDFIKCEFRKTGEQIDPLLYTDVLAFHSGTNSELYGGLLMLMPVTQRTRQFYERVASCKKR